MGGWTAQSPPSTFEVKNDLPEKEACVRDSATGLKSFCIDWEIKQQLIQLAQTMTGEETEREIMTTLSVEHGVSSHRVLAAKHDRASMNDVAMPR